jgi:hypothetical protein
MLWLLVAVILVGQTPLPEPRAKKEERPATPQRIRAGGCGVQAAYTGPAPQWFNQGVASLSDSQITELEASLSTSPEDRCTRGYLIAHGAGHVAGRLDHLLWMIANHPQWDGFVLTRLSLPQQGDEPGAYERIKAAWLERVGPDWQNGTVLHHAAIFFQGRDPAFSVELLERAISLGPDVPLYTETLGGVYGRALIRSDHLSLASRAKTVLEASNDRVLLAGALNAIGPFRPVTTDGEKMLWTKFGGRPALAKSHIVVREVPSFSEKYRRYRCAAIPLLRPCVSE